ncbi:MAG: hypothetical protein ACI9T8_000518 [Candidatus Saccharimonadales bacterium]|jgi:hypothetical protein
MSIAKELDGSFLIYSRVAEPDLEEYFSEYSMIATKQWLPAFNLIVEYLLIDQRIDDSTYLAGDFNIAGMEDAYITGIFVDNQVTKPNS